LIYTLFLKTNLIIIVLNQKLRYKRQDDDGILTGENPLENEEGYVRFDCMSGTFSDAPPPSI
jgi:hypothetical protein